MAETVTHRCRTCDRPVAVARVDVTTSADLPNSKFMWGRWDQCQGCGSTAEPRLVVDEKVWLGR